jgi:hypothetical protein
MARFDPIAFIAEHGVVLASAKGPVPNLADAVTGEPIRGSWWGHEKGSQIFRALGAAGESADVLCFRLVSGKNTLVHRRLWPALVRLADQLGKDALTAIQQEHTETGAHSESEARALLGSWLPPSKKKPAGRRR